MESCEELKKAIHRLPESIQVVETDGFYFVEANGDSQYREVWNQLFLALDFDHVLRVKSQKIGDTFGMVIPKS